MGKDSARPVSDRILRIFHTRQVYNSNRYLEYLQFYCILLEKSYFLGQSNDKWPNINKL